MSGGNLFDSRSDASWIMLIFKKPVEVCVENLCRKACWVPLVAAFGDPIASYCIARVSDEHEFHHVASDGRVEDDIGR